MSLKTLICHRTNQQFHQCCIPVAKMFPSKSRNEDSSEVLKGGLLPAAEFVFPHLQTQDEDGKAEIKKTNMLYFHKRVELCTRVSRSLGMP